MNDYCIALLFLIVHSMRASDDPLDSPTNEISYIKDCSAKKDVPACEYHQVSGYLALYPNDIDTIYTEYSAATADCDAQDLCSGITSEHIPESNSYVYSMRAGSEPHPSPANEISYVKDCSAHDYPTPENMGCEYPEYQLFKAAVASYYERGVINLNLLMLMSKLVSQYHYLLDICRPVALLALLMKMEDQMYHDPEYVSSMMPLYLEQLAFLDDEEFSAWPVKHVYLRVIEHHPRHWLPNPAYNLPPTVDVVICFCGREHQPGEGYDSTLEDLGWLEDVCLGGVCQATTRLLVYEKCGSFPTVHRLLRERFEPVFKEVAIVEVQEEVRADDCTAYLRHIVNSSSCNSCGRSSIFIAFVG